MITYSVHSGPSARMLRDEIYRLTGIRYKVSNTVDREVHINYGNPDIRIRCEHNNPNFIRLCSDKRAFCDTLARQGIVVPTYKRGVPESFPCIVRESLYSYGGRGTHAFHNVEEYRAANLPNNLYWSPFLVCESEFRVHVLGGQIKKVNKKVWRQEGPEADLPIRNHHQGYYFRLVTPETWQKMDKLVERVNLIHRTIGGSFYGLDMGYSRASHDWVVFEANTGIGLDEPTVGFYADYFIDVLGLRRLPNVPRTDAAAQGS